MLQSATADSRSVQNPPIQRTAGGHPLPIMDKDDLEAGEQDNGNPIMDALQSWSAWPDFIKETLDPSETSKALARQKQSRSTSSTGPDTSPDIDLMYGIPALMHGKHGSALGKIHTIDPVETSRTLCGWYYERFNSETHIFSTTPFPSNYVAIKGASNAPQALGAGSNAPYERRVTLRATGGGQGRFCRRVTLRATGRDEFPTRAPLVRSLSVGYEGLSAVYGIVRCRVRTAQNIASIRSTAAAVMIQSLVLPPSCLPLILFSEPTRLGMIPYAVFCL